MSAGGGGEGLAEGAEGGAEDADEGDGGGGYALGGGGGTEVAPHGPDEPPGALGSVDTGWPVGEAAGDGGYAEPDIGYPLGPVAESDEAFDFTVNWH